MTACPRLTSHRLGLGFVLLLAGCSDGTGTPSPVDPCGVGQEVEVTASSEPIPVFSWTPACGLSSLQVWDPNQTSGWMLFTGPRTTAG